MCLCFAAFPWQYRGMHSKLERAEEPAGGYTGYIANAVGCVVL